MINSNVFDYVNVLNKAADASWIRNEAISNNMANVDTPGYKRQDIQFAGELERALKKSRYNKTMDEKISDIKTSELKPRTYKDHENFSYRLDGNNVDIDTENAMMAKNNLTYNGLIQSINDEFTLLKMVTR